MVTDFGRTMIPNILAIPRQNIFLKMELIIGKHNQNHHYVIQYVYYICVSNLIKITYKLTRIGNVFCVNVFEILWAALKHHLRKYVKPTNKEEYMVEGIKDFWSKQCRSQGHCFVGGK